MLEKLGAERREGHDLQRQGEHDEPGETQREPLEIGERASEQRAGDQAAGDGDHEDEHDSAEVRGSATRWGCASLR